LHYHYKVNYVCVYVLRVSLTKKNVLLEKTNGHPCLQDKNHLNKWRAVEERLTPLVFCI
jgi:hypothetical protein